jgi:RecA-family ATPase
MLASFSRDNMTLYICALRNPDVGGGLKAELFYKDPAEAERFVERWNGTGTGIYDCVGRLRDGARRRCKEEVVALEQLVIDLDLKNMVETHEAVLQALRGLVLPPSEIRDSGNGLHAVWRLKEPVIDAAGLDQAETTMKRLATLLAGDQAPTHRAALLRRPGSDNTKGGFRRPCRVLESTGAIYDIGEFGDLFDLYSGRPLLHYKQPAEAPVDSKSKANGTIFDGEWKGPVDVEARLAAMRYGGTDGTSVNDTQKSVIPALLRRAIHPDDVIETVVNATMDMARRAGLNWSREVELKTVTARCLSGVNLLQGDYDASTGEIPAWLAGEFHEAWTAALSQGKKPALSRNRSGWHVRSYPLIGGEDKSKGEGVKDERKRRVTIKPYVPINPADLPPRRYLYARHYQRRVVSGTVAPGGTGKTSKGMVEAVALATCRNLLGEQPEERCRVWLHNGEDSIEELYRRIVAICQHYEIPQQELEGWLFVTSGTEMGLKVANGYNELKIDNVLIEDITRTILDNAIDVFIVDPLVTLHSVPESDNGKMDTVIRIFTRIADLCECSIDVAHHTRKLPAGSYEHTVDDARGASAIRDAVRSLRILNVMSAAEAAQLGMDEFERLSYFRVDQGKANTVPPAKKATWHKFENVALPNGDNVGVVTAWERPDATPTGKAEAERRADRVFLELLDRFQNEGRFVNHRAGPGSAPTTFAKEPEAKTAKITKDMLADAMRRLFSAGAIKAEDYGRPDRPHQRLVRASPPTGLYEMD